MGNETKLTGFHIMPHLFGNSYTSAVEPLLAAVTGDHELVLVRLPANTPEAFWVILRFPILVK